MFKKILTPLDGSETSERVLAWAAPLAEKLKAELILTTVVEAEPVPATPITAGGPRPDPPEVMAEREVRLGMYDRLHNAAMRYLESTARRLVPANVEVTFNVVSGNPEDEIVAQAIATEADLIAMATHRASPIARGVLGSIADRVVRSSPVSVLLLRPGNGRSSVTAPQPIKNVIVPLDASPTSEMALDTAMAIALATDARLHLMTATVGTYIHGPRTGAPFGHLYTGGQMRADAREYLKPFVEEALDEGIEADAIAVSSSPARAIIRAAHEEPGTIVVMATHGLRGFQRWVLGSVTDQVIRGAECPVLIVTTEDPGVN
ncbi:MAG: universal stress protein [Chloroflexi bacterium]|nr:universal stress protein [Chloroflexota bacterium]